MSTNTMLTSISYHKNLIEPGKKPPALTISPSLQHGSLLSDLHTTLDSSPGM